MARSPSNHEPTFPPAEIWARTLVDIFGLYRAPTTNVSGTPTFGTEITSLLWIGSERNGFDVRLNEPPPLTVTARRQVLEGQTVTLQDIDLESPALVLDENGTPLSFAFLFVSFLTIVPYFNFAPGQPSLFGTQPAAKFPLRDYLEHQRYESEVRPVELLPRLRAVHWPPSGCYFPDVLAHVRSLPEDVEVDDEQIIASLEQFGFEYWQKKVTSWQSLGVTSRRHATISRAFERHFAEDYISAVHIMVVQIEGLARDHLSWAGCEVPPNQKQIFLKVRELVLGRPFIVGSKQIREDLFNFIDVQLMRKFQYVIDPSRELSRHGIAHGAFSDVDSEALSWRFIALLDGLVQVLLLDRVAAGDPLMTRRSAST